MIQTHFATVIGPHKKVLQDAYGYNKGKDYIISIVADGVGSASHSEIGANAAVWAVDKAIREWRNLKHKKDDILLRLIHFYWKLKIIDSTYELNECSTTCLFAYFDIRLEKLYLGQLGDGLIYFQNRTKSFIVKLESDQDFNQTKALGDKVVINDWILKHVSLSPKDEFGLMMMTDGIADDIKDGAQELFLEKLINTLNPIKKYKRNKFLFNELAEWPTKYHSDDKTLIIQWQKINKKK